MKLRTRLMMFTAAVALSANMAHAAINAQSLADAYIKEGYTYVEVKVGPTQTKLEAVKGDRKVEVIYDNATGDVIKSEFDDADDDYVGKTGVEIDTSDDDFSDDDSSDDDEDDSEDDADEGDDDNSDDDENDDDSSDDDENDDDQDDDDESDDSESDDSESDDSSDDSSDDNESNDD